MPDFALLPPEVNSGLMYAGPGAGPMLAAAAGWHALAAELESTALGYSAVVAGLSGLAWSGPSSLAMAAAAAPYVGWLSATGAAAVQTGVQASAAAAAYEVAFAMTVAPAVIEANRALLMALIATNFFGQNTAAIAATEAQYAEYWLQDATAMYGYAGASETASALTSFDEPPQTTNQSDQDQPDGPNPTSPTHIDPGSGYNAGNTGATVTVNDGSITVGQGATIWAPQQGESITGGVNGAYLSYPEFTQHLYLAPGKMLPPNFPTGNLTVVSGTVNVPQGSTVFFSSGSSLTGGVQGASVTVTEGSITPTAAVTPATTVSPAAAAPAATAGPASTSSTSTTSSASTSSTSGTTSGTTSAPAEQVPGAQAPGAEPQAPSGVAQAAPGLAPPHAVPGFTAPLAAPGGVVAVAGGPAPLGGPAALGDPLQWIANVQQPPPDASHLAFGEQLGQPLVRTDQVVLTSGATLLGAGGGGGLTTFASTKATFYRGETVITKTQHEALIRDASLRFMKSFDTVQSKISSSSTLELSAGLDELMSSNHEVRNLFDLVQAGAAAPTVGQALEILSGATETTSTTLDQIATAAFRAAPQMSELHDMITEMKLIMPSDVLLKAQYAAIATLFAAHISEADTPTSNWTEASSAAVDDFVQAVRIDFGLDPIASA